MKNITAAFITKNEEENIGECLESVKWVNEIVVVDAFSSDKTAQICKKYTNKIFQKEFTDFSSQKNFALSKATNDWILFIDADERITLPLKEEIHLLPQDGCDGYSIPRKNIIFGRHLKYGGHQNDVQMRLFRKTKSRFENQIHEKVVISGNTGTLHNYLEHYSTHNISEYAEKLNLYTDLEARLMKTQGKALKISDLIIKPAAQFLLRYILKGGFRDGMEGFMFYSASSFYTFIKYAKFWEIQKQEGVNVQKL